MYQKIISARMTCGGAHTHVPDIPVSSAQGCLIQSFIWWTLLQEVIYVNKPTLLHFLRHGFYKN